MKKLVYLLIAVSLMLALVPAVASADEITVDLLAGQTEDIGDVKVWNDAEKLYVQFVYTGPDCGFLEVHLQVDEGTWSEDILTKKGNPKPGQFEKSYKPGGCFTEHTFTYNLADEGFAPGDNLLIAAHAALGLAETMTIVSDTSTGVVNGTVTPAVLANEPVGYPNCANYAPDGTGSAWDSSVNILGAHWIWNFANPEHPKEGDVVDFQRIFSVPGFPIAGNLTITADNAYSAMLNGVFIGSAQFDSGFPPSLMEDGVHSQGWQSVESWPLAGLVSGDNTLMITAANEYMWPGDASDPYPGTGIGGTAGTDGSPNGNMWCRNPAGLIFKATVDYYADGETAWGAGTRFTLDKNWATYFTYEVQEICTNVPELVNGSFESPVVTATQGWDIFPSGTTGLGWTVEWVGTTTSWDSQTRPDPAVLELQKSGVVVNAYEGNQYAELDTDWGGPGAPGSGEPASVAISQDLATCSGEQYTLEYAWSPRPGHNSALQVYWGTELIATHTGSTAGWNSESETVIANGESMLLKFVETGPEDSYGMFLDDVRIITP